MTSCTLPSASMAKPVWRQAITSEWSKAGLAAGHHVGVVAEDVQGLGGHGTGGHMEDAGQQLAGDLVHVGDHQQQALGGGIGGGQSARGQRAVNGTGGAGLRLHLDHLHGGAEDVLLTLFTVVPKMFFWPWAAHWST